MNDDLNEEQWREAWQLFQAAGDLEVDQAGAFLSRSEASPEVRDIVARMILADNSLSAGPGSNGMSGSAALGLSTSRVPVAPLLPGTEIDRYQLIEKIGEGGMGEVWLAEQQEPVRRRVALKRIKGGEGSREVIARFESERQALAMMDHPGIAKVFDAGSTAQGIPYFVMEYAEGEPITTYCDNRRLNTRARLELFVQVCEAVEHAHRKAIIHRDLKPSNILVTEVNGVAVPKVIDFGVAKALTQKLSADTIHTRVGALVGTPEYMSPEQAASSGADIDTRTDVYSLGIVFYELLAGVRPVDFHEVGLEEFLRRLREDDTPRLSNRVSTADAATSLEVARRRQTEPAALTRQLRGDLDAIALKALEKDRARRYGSATEFAADVGRYLRNEPVLAVAPSLAYRAGKFARRNRVGVLMGVAFLLVLIAAAVITTRQYLRANREAAIAQAVNDFLQNDLLAKASTMGQSQAGQKVDRNLTVRTVLDRAAATIPGRFDRQPEVETQIQRTIGVAYYYLGEYPAAHKHLQRVLDLQRRTFGEDSQQTLRALVSLAKCVAIEYKLEEAEALLLRALDIARRMPNLASDPSALGVRSLLGQIYMTRGKNVQAERMVREQIEVDKRVLGPEHVFTATALEALGTIDLNTGNFEEAESCMREAVSVYRRLYGADSLSVIQAETHLAAAFSGNGQHAAAQELAHQLVEKSTRVLGPEHNLTSAAVESLATDYYLTGKYTEAFTLLDADFRMLNRVFGLQQNSTRPSLFLLARTELMLGKNAEAEAHLLKVLELMRRQFGPDAGPPTLNALTLLYLREKKTSLAENYGAQALTVCQHSFGAENQFTMWSASMLALAHHDAGKFTEAETLAREALAFYTGKQPDDWRRYETESLVGASLAGEKKFSEAETLLVGGYQGMVARKSKIDAPDLYYLDRAHESLVEFYRAWGKADKAAEWEHPAVPSTP
jgi:tetratricopeptide (TPR) repeat protein